MLICEVKKLRKLKNQPNLLVNNNHWILAFLSEEAWKSLFQEEQEAQPETPAGVRVDNRAQKRDTDAAPRVKLITHAWGHIPLEPGRIQLADERTGRLRAVIRLRRRSAFHLSRRISLI